MTAPHPALHLLEYQLSCGVTDIVTDAPVDRTVRPVIVEEKQAPATHAAPLSQKDTETMPRKPAAAVDFDADALLQRTRAEADAAQDMDALRAAICAFDAMPVCKAAIQPVFGDGVIGSDVMLVGEAPGQQEDEQGIPFCGASGQLLEQILNAVHLRRSDNYYITNTMFWRPPGNRKPTDAEIAVCRPYVEKIIALNAPKIIILVGATAIQSILGDKTGITKMRGEFRDYSNAYIDAPIPAIPVFHPSYLLRSPGQKRAMWEDMLIIEEKLKHLQEAAA